MKSKMFISHPNGCLTVIHRTIFPTKSDLDDYIGKHVYHKNHRKKKYVRVIGKFNHRNTLYSLKFKVSHGIASF